MKILALDTAQWVTSVALWEDGKELAFQETIQERDQAARLPSLVHSVLEDQIIDLILVNRGPGSFTGIRVGLAFAKGLSLGLGVPLKGIDGFTAMHQSLTTPDPVLILLDAHRKDVFGQLFQSGIIHPPQSYTREDVQSLLQETPSLLIAQKGIDSFLTDFSFQETTPLWKNARALAHTFFKDSSFAKPALPLYIREADVTISTNFC